MILVLSGKADVHYQHIASVLGRRRVDHALFNWQDFPEKASVGFRGESVEVRLPGRTLRSEDILSVWNRRRGQPSAPQGVTEKELREYIRIESQSLLDGLSSRTNALWVNKPEAVNLAANKPFHLPIAKSLGFRVPDTYFGNSVELAREFLREHEILALKPLRTSSIQLPGASNQHGGLDLALFYTRKVARDDLLENIENVATCPVIIQPYIEKDFELRITVVGNEVWACEIHSQQTPRTKEDWRRYSLKETPHKVHKLPEEVRNLCLDLLRKLDLRFGCIDMIVTPAGDYVFLEINPNGQWLWIERLTGMAIGESIVDLLTST